MLRVKHHFVSFFVFIYLSISYLGATHIHNDIVEHHESCSICIIIHNFTGLDNNNNILSINSSFFGIYETIITPIQTFISTILLKGFNANAPPSLFSL